MRRQRNTVNSLIESAKKEYISALLDNNSSCPKKFWKHINQFLKGEYGTYHHRNFIGPETGNSVKTEPDFLNDYFVNISSRLGFGPNHVIDFDNNYLDMYSDIDDFFDISSDPPTVEEVVLYSNEIDMSKNSCIDGISSVVCKDLLVLNPELFVSIFHSSLTTNIFPSAWSKGIVTVIPKIGDLSDPANWRPITQTPIFAKILEKIVYNRMANYFAHNNVLSSYQYGFRPGRSTQQAIFDLTKYIYSNLNHKKIICSICLDVAKAFGCINHDLLLHKMSKIGFCNNSIAWFKSYLTRTQVVKFDKEISTELPVQTGIGQGTILGPIIFIFYINDIISVIRHLKINMYADDCILYTSGNDWTKMIAKIQPEIDNVQRWYDNNLLKVSIKKSKVLLIGSRNKLGKVDMTKNIKIGDTPLPFTKKYKYLGVTLNNEMTLSYYLSDTKETVMNRLFNLRKLRTYITEKSAVSIYKQTILPVLDYAGFMLISCNKSDRRDLQVIQNDALRTFYNIKRRDRFSVTKMHQKAHLLSLDQRRVFQLMGLMFLHRKNPRNIRIPARNTRGANRDQFVVERYNNLKYKNSPFYKGSELWQHLPLDIVTSDSIFSFKKCLKNRYKTYVDELL